MQLKHKQGPLLSKTAYKDVKDPCPVFDGTKWHIFGSGGSVQEEKWYILHATAPEVFGPWEEELPAFLEGVSGDHVAAPGVIFEKGVFHMFVQTDFLATNGTVEHLVSTDGKVFVHTSTALTSLPNTPEAGVYDPHPCVIGGKKYLVYSGTPEVTHMGTHFISQPDVFLAQSDSWNGPWKRIGKILDHAEIAWHHNQREDHRYEWGIEGPQLIELPTGKILLNATCFLPEGNFGTRQRAFFAISEHVVGPYTSLGPIIHSNLQEWESGENGHAAGFVQGNEILLFYQARSAKETDIMHIGDWRYGIATFDISSL